MRLAVINTCGMCSSGQSFVIYSMWIYVLILLTLSTGVLGQTTTDYTGSEDVSKNIHQSNSINSNNNNDDDDGAVSHLHGASNSTIANVTHPLQVKFLKQPFIFIDLDSTKTVTWNYTLQCDHPSTIYVVMAKSVMEDVATIIAGNPVKISCTFGTITDTINKKQSQQNINTSGTNNVGGNKAVVKRAIGDNSGGANSMMNDTHRANFEISGQFEMLFESHRIGRSFFLMFATKVSGPGAQKFPGYEMRNANQTNSDDGRVGMARDKKGSIQNKPTGGSSEKRGSPTGGLPPNAIVKSMILVMKLPTAVDEIFRIVLYVVIISATIGMGIKVEFDVVVKVMKKPLGPCIGLFCQYVCMPLIAYVVAKTVPQPSAAISLGIFTCGIVPGGGASNFWCYLLGGDVTLSVTMTTISSVAALGLIPMWLFTLGENFKDETADIHVPYTKILETLAIVLLPVFAGMLLKRKLPKVAKLISKVLKPFLVIIVIFLLAVGIYANFFIFSMIRPMQILAGCLLPYVGYIIGGGIALLTCRTWEHVKTIAIETGIQNTGIAFMIVFFSLQPPDNQLAVVAPAASAIMTPLPLLVVTFFYTIYIRRQRKKENANAPNGNGGNDDAFLKDSSHHHTSKAKSIWDRITGKRSRDQTPDMEEMLNQEVKVTKEKEHRMGNIN